MPNFEVGQKVKLIAPSRHSDKLIVGQVYEIKAGPDPAQDYKLWNHRKTDCHWAPSVCLEALPAQRRPTVGDQVRIVQANDPCNARYVGQIAQITYDDRDGRPYRLRVGDNGLSGYFKEHQVALADGAPVTFARGDKVQIVSQGGRGGRLMDFKFQPMFTVMEVVRGPDSDGDYQIKAADQSTFLVHSSDLAPYVPGYTTTRNDDGTLTLTPLPATPPQPEPRSGQIWRENGSGALLLLTSRRNFRIQEGRDGNWNHALVKEHCTFAYESLAAAVAAGERFQ